MRGILGALLLFAAAGAAWGRDPRVATLLAGAASAEEARDYTGAIQDWKKLLEIEPGNAAAWYNIGQDCYRKGDREGAVAALGNAIRLGPEGFDALCLRGKIYCAQGKYNAAIADLNAGIEGDGSDQEALLSRATAYYATGEYGRALDDFNKVTQLMGPRPIIDDAPALNAEAWLLATCPEAKYRDGPAAVDLAKKACELTDWKVPHIIDTLAAAQAETGKWEEAVKDEEQAVELAGAAKESAKKLEEYNGHLAAFRKNTPWRETVVVSPGERKLTEARLAAEARAEAAREADRKRAQAQRAFDGGDFKQGIECWSEVVKIAPEDSAGWVGLAKARAAGGDAKEALVDYGKAIQFDPKNAGAYAARGDTYLKMKDADHALADFQAALRLAPSAAANAQCGAACMLKADQPPPGTDGAALENLRKQAAAYYGGAIKLEPRNTAYHITRAGICHMLGDWEKAAADYTAVLEIEPGNSFAVYCRGDTYARMERWDKAVADESQAHVAMPENVAALVVRGHAYAMEGECELALADFHQAMTAGPHDWSAPEALAWFQATCPDAKYRDGAKAVELATAVCKQSFRVYSSPIDTLAAAQAEAGNWDAAVSEEKAAIQKSGEWKESAKIIEARKARLALFEQKKPYREGGK